MGAAASLPTGDSPDVAATRNALGEWPLARVLALNHTFRASSKGFLMDAATAAEVLDVPMDLAHVICRTLSRNSKKKSVNIMTVLAVRLQSRLDLVPCIHLVS